VSDGIAMGTEGMKASLISREVIADSIEMVARGHLFDAVVAIVGCDKTITGAAMALARLNLPSVLLYGGSIMPRHIGDRDLTIQTLHLLAIVFEACVALHIHDFDSCNDRSSYLADIKPGVCFVSTDLYRAGGLPLIAKRLLDSALLHDNSFTVTGRTIGD